MTGGSANRLTLNLGYRYEYISPYGDKFSQIGRFNPNAIEPATGMKGLFTWVPAGGYHTNPNYNTPGPASAWLISSTRRR